MIAPIRKHSFLLAFSLMLAALCADALLAAPALADITVNVDQAAVQPLPIAIPAFSGGATGAQIAGVVSADLARSGLFRPLDPATFSATPDVSQMPNFDPWKGISAQALLLGAVSSGADGRLSVDFRLWDVYAGDQLVGMHFTAAPDSWRRIAHQIADKVYEKLTGEPGYFDTRLIFVAESGPKNKKVMRLEMMDQDGYGAQYLNLGFNDPTVQVFSPRFSHNGAMITYMALRPSDATVYIMNLDTGRQEVVGHFPGMTMAMAPRFSPDDRRVVFAAIKNGVSNIYVMDLATHQISQLSQGLSIDTSPSYSPSGEQIVFNSDRGGSPQLYVMNADGSNAHRISFGAGRYTGPVWSPDGKLIAFVRQEGDRFAICVMNPDGSGERVLTTSYFSDEPTWSPNSRVLMFERKVGEGESRLWTVDLTGHIQKQADYPSAGSDPSWSPLLH